MSSMEETEEPVLVMDEESSIITDIADMLEAVSASTSVTEPVVL